MDTNLKNFEVQAYSEEHGGSNIFTVEAADRVAAIEVMSELHPDWTVKDWSGVTEI